MKLNLSKNALLQLDKMSKIRGGEIGGDILGKYCLSKPMPLDTPCNHAAWGCPQIPPIIKPKPHK